MEPKDSILNFSINRTPLWGKFKKPIADLIDHRGLSEGGC